MYLHLMIRRLCNVRLPMEFFNYINLEENFKQLNELNLKFTTCHNITIEFLKEDKNFELIKDYFQKYYITYQSSFSKIFPNYYLRNNKRAIKNHVFPELLFTRTFRCSY